MCVVMLVPPGNGRSSVVAAGFGACARGASGSSIPAASIERPWPITFRVHFALVRPRADRLMAHMPKYSYVLKQLRGISDTYVCYRN
ncbi:hypothetical protein HNP40_001107 [Mycobacteroides chelonae]|nr:hypothetical protein [Mycobacteroides chelonae]